ncbi:hypothetical protein KR044_006395, partial [Drosophila immigrans]
MQLHFDMLPLLIFAVCFVAARAECNSCTLNTNIACISDSKFQFCAENRPVAPINSCPVGFYCSNEPSICQQNSTLKACRDCGRCSVARSFACLGPRSYALCLGSNSPTTLTGTCSADYVCNIHLAGICGKATKTSPTCSWD